MDGRFSFGALPLAPSSASSFQRLAGMFLFETVEERSRAPGYDIGAHWPTVTVTTPGNVIDPTSVLPEWPNVA